MNVASCTLPRGAKAMTARLLAGARPTDARRLIHLALSMDRRLKLVTVVDDDVDTQEFLSAVLESQGYRVVSVSDGFDALIVIERYRPDVVLTDILMPNMNGIDLVSRIKSFRADLPVIVFSGYRDALVKIAPAASENCVLAALDAELFKACFTAWVEGLRAPAPDRIAIDGKTSRRSHARGAGREPLHLVSAWACEQRLVLGQEAVRGKSNEITARAPSSP